MPQDSNTPAHAGQTMVPAGHRFLLLFLFLLALLVLYPYFQSARSVYVFRVLGAGITLLSVYAVSFRRSLVLVAVVLAMPALFQRVAFIRLDGSVLSVLNMVLTFAFDVFVVVVIFRRVFANERPTSENIFGALCIYLMVGFSFAGIYAMVALVQPHAFYFDPLTNLHLIPDRFDFIYYSFGTMTSLGAPGITPVSNQARSLSVIEAILGLLYLAVLISRLMGAYRPHYQS